MRILAEDGESSYHQTGNSHKKKATQAGFWQAHLTTLEKHSDGASVGVQARAETDPVELTRRFLVENLVDSGLSCASTEALIEECMDEDGESATDEMDEDEAGNNPLESLVTTEHAWLCVVNTVFRLAAQTSTLRSALASNTKAAAEQLLKAELARAKNAMDTRIARLPSATPFSQAKGTSNTDPTRQEQIAEIKQAHAVRVRAVERRHNLRLRVQASRTAPIGCDGAGRVYWHFPPWASSSATAASAGTGEEDYDYFIVTPAEDATSLAEENNDKMDLDVELVDEQTDNTSGVPRNLQCLSLTRDNLQILIAWLRSEQTSLGAGSPAEVRRLEDYAKKLLAMTE